MAADKVYEALQGSFFSLEIDDLQVAWFTGCSGIGIDIEVMTQKITNGKKTIENKMAGRAKYSEVVLKRGLTASTDLNDWFQSVLDATDDTPRKSGSIVIFDRVGDKEMARFNLLNCWPSKLTISDLSAGQDTPMIEEVTIVHERLEWA